MKMEKILVQGSIKFACLRLCFDVPNTNPWKEHNHMLKCNCVGSSLTKQASSLHNRLILTCYGPTLHQISIFSYQRLDQALLSFHNCSVTTLSIILPCDISLPELYISRKACILSIFTLNRGSFCIGRSQLINCVLSCRREEFSSVFLICNS